MSDLRGWGKYGVDWTSTKTLRLAPVKNVMRELVEAVNERIGMHNRFLYQTYVPRIRELNCDLMPVPLLIYQAWQAIILMTSLYIPSGSPFSYSARWLQPDSFEALLAGDDTAKSEYPFPGMSVDYINAAYGYELINNMSYASIPESSNNYQLNKNQGNIQYSVRLRTFASAFWALRDCLNRMIYFNTAGDYYAYISCCQSKFWLRNNNFTVPTWDAAYSSMETLSSSYYMSYLRLYYRYSRYYCLIYDVDYHITTPEEHPVRCFLRADVHSNYPDEDPLLILPDYQKWNLAFTTATNQTFNFITEGMVRAAPFGEGMFCLNNEGYSGSKWGVMPVIDLSDADTGFEFIPS